MLMWMDGFDAYGTDGATVTSLLETCGYMQGGSYGDFKTHSFTQSGIGYSLSIDYPGSIVLPFGTSPGVVVGFRVYATSNSGQLCCFRYNDLMGASNSITTMFRVWLDGQNGIAVGTQDGELIAASPPNAFLENVWYYVEIKYVPSHSSGTIAVKVDGVEYINVTGVKTATAGSPTQTVNQFQFGTESNAATHGVIGGIAGYFDDFYIEDTTGTGFNDFLGNVAVHDVFPASDAGPNTMTQTGGGAGHFTTVDEQAPDGDVSYVSGNSSGQKELYTVSTLPTDIIDILAVSVNVRARKAAIGDANYSAVLVYNGSESDSPVFPAASTYTETHYIVTTPPGGGAWSLVNVQNSQIGVLLP